jgi:mRNA interferase RelE/StbE
MLGKLGKPLKSKFKGLWHYRAGDYRIVCEIQDQDLIVLIVRVASRKDIYNR